MRVLVVDQDSTLLTAITRTLGEYFSIDAVTNKADCLDLVRLNEFDVIVAGERLEDGSGLELLGQLGRSRPDMLRIFAAERERLKLLKGRLGPFGLFRTLTYPIQPRQLLAALSAAGGTEEYDKEYPAPEAEVAAAPSPTPAVQVAPAVQMAPATEPAARTPEPVTVMASSAARAPAQRYRVGSPAGSSATATNNAQTAQAAPARQTSSAGATARARGTAVPGQRCWSGLAAASKLDIVTRPKGYPLPSDTSPARSAFLVGAGMLLVLGGLALSFKIFNTKDEPVAPATNVSATRNPHFPPEVVKLVADTEVAFQQDNFKTARTDVAALQQIAPDHPRLPFFESLLKRLDATNRDASARAASARTLSRPVASSARAPTAAAISRRQPDNNRDTASTSGAVATPVSATSVATFAGRTLEDSSPGTATQPEANPSQATATPVPRRPGSAAPPPDTQDARLVQHVAAEYPPDAARKGIEGSVDVSFTVTSQGKVTDVLVLDAEPSEIFNRSAVAAVRRWKYDPKTIDGVPVESHQQLRLQFKLDARR